MNSIVPIEEKSEETGQRKSIRFQARSFLAFALAPEAPLDEWLEGLDRWTENSPGFFAGRPVVLDLNLLNPEPLEVGELVALLARRGIRVYAIEANGLDALGEDLPPLLKGARQAAMDEPEPEAEVEEAVSTETLIIEAPIRSGQSVYHPAGDVVVLGSVGSGSEIVAGGSIHIYGTLRGRAFAGANGNGTARIFCRKNEAELLSVDGWYLTTEEMDHASRGRPIQVFMDNGAIQVAALN